MSERKLLLLSESAEEILRYRVPLLQRLRSEGFDPLLLCPGGEAAEQLRETGFRVSLLACGSGGFPAWPAAQLGLLLLFLRERPVIIQCESLRLALRFWLPLRLRGSCALLVGAGEEGFQPRAGGWGRAVRLRLLLRGGRRKPLRFLCEDPAELSQAAAAGLPVSSCVELPGPGIDFARFHPPKEERLIVEGQKLRVLYAGPLRRDAGLETLRMACLILAAKKIAPELLVVGELSHGDGVAESELMAWQKEGWMRWVRSSKAIENLLRSAELVVIPAATARSGRLLTEAAACRRALLVADEPSLSRLVEQERSGLLFRAGDAPSLARAMERLLREADQREAFGGFARAKLKATHSAKVVVPKILELYLSLLNQA